MRNLDTIRPIGTGFRIFKNLLNFNFMKKLLMLIVFLIGSIVYVNAQGKNIQVETEDGKVGIIYLSDDFDESIFENIGVGNDGGGDEGGGYQTQSIRVTGGGTSWTMRVDRFTSMCDIFSMLIDLYDLRGGYTGNNYGCY